MKRTYLALLLALLLPTLAAAEKLTGAIRNATTGKPAAGVEVVILRLDQGMEEAARTKTDASGRFSVDLADASAPHLVRARHQEVNYFRQAPPGTQSVELEVFDSTPKPVGISTVANILRIQAEGDRMQVTEVHAVKNDSQPPRTWMAEPTYQLFLPEGAKIESSMAGSPGSMPVTSAPVPDDKEKGKYGFYFPIRPGETRFQFDYTLPYSGQAAFQPRLLFPTEHVVVMLPSTMQFTPGSGIEYQSMNEGDTQIRVATSVTPGQPLSFSVSGTGAIADTQGQAGGEQAQQPTGPGGGLGAPIDTPDPLSEYRWLILAGFAIALAGGAFFALRRPAKPASTYTSAPASPSAPAAPQHEGPTPPAAARAPRLNGDRPAVLLEALKEELFQLEVERAEGKLSPDEYARAKAALDLTIERALGRQKQTVQ